MSQKLNQLIFNTKDWQSLKNKLSSLSKKEKGDVFELLLNIFCFRTLKGDWLGTGAIATQLKKYRSFVEARKFIHSLKLISESGWKQFCNSGKKPENIPISPYKVYKNKGWISWGDWLGTGRISNQLKQYTSFHGARNFVHSLQLESQSEWNQYCKLGRKPENIPITPYHVYKNKGWISWGDWLGKKGSKKRIK